MARPASAKRLKAIKDDLHRYLAFIQDSLNETVANDIGVTITTTMLLLISKGISPIEGNGRFPAYKWAEFRNNLKKERSAIGRALKKNKKSWLVYKRKNKRQILLAQKEANRKDQSFVNNRYPFTAEAKRWGKKPRPVNLRLSGDFLTSLEHVVTKTAEGVGLEIGFWDPLSIDKEQGHREGANTQPERPIIPIDREEFAQTILNAVFKKIEQVIDREAARRASSI